MEEKPMRVIKLFIASSYELKEERDAITAFVAGLNVTLNKQNVNLQPVRWEFLSSSWSVGDKQEEYNKKVRESDICFVLFWTIRGKFTCEEMDTAYRQLVSGAPNKLYVFFKDITEEDRVTKKLSKKDIKNLELFRNSLYDKYHNWPVCFEHVDTLKMEILRNLFIYLNEDLPGGSLFSFGNGKIHISENTSIDLKNVPFYGNNEEYQQLCANIDKTKKLLTIYKPEDSEYAKYSQELLTLTQRQEDIEKGVWETAVEVSKLKAGQSSGRLKRAIQLFEEGNSKAAQALLDESRIAHDVQQNLHLVQLGKDGRQGLQTNLDEYLLKIKLVTDDMEERWQDKVKALFEKCFEIGEDNLEKEKYASLLSRCDGFYSFIGDSTLALDYGKKAMRIRLDIFGEKHPDVAASYNNVGCTYGELGEYEKELEYLLKALDIRRDIFGEKHPDVAASYNNVGCTYGELGEHEKELEYLLKALDIWQNIFGEKHPNVAASYNNIGTTYGALGEHKKALDYKLKALDIWRDIFGEKHPNVATSYNNIGATYGKLGEHKKALDYKLKALDIRRDIFGEKHPDVAASYNNVGSTYGKLGNHRKEREYLEKALQIRKALDETERQ